MVCMLTNFIYIYIYFLFFKQTQHDKSTCGVDGDGKRTDNNVVPIIDYSAGDAAGENWQKDVLTCCVDFLHRREFQKSPLDQSHKLNRTRYN